ncbi:MAG: ABC transporter permease [Acidobacteriota bacterium]
MESLVLANIKHRPTRVLVTAAGVAIGTVLILLIVGLMRGMLKERGTREANVAAEIIARPSGSFQTLGLGANSLSMPVDTVEKVRQLPGIKSATPMGQFLQTTDSGIGFRAIDAIEVESYFATSGIKLIEGQPPTNDEEVIVDEDYAGRHKLKPGDPVNALDRTFKVAGIYTPQVGTRIKVRLSMLQSMLASEGRCTMLLVRCENPAQQEEIAQRILKILPDAQVIFTRDLPQLYTESLPMFTAFARVMVGLAVFISTLVILLAMYTTITERTREIGILKSLGASRTFIVWIVEKEALVISTLGVSGGYLIAVIARFFVIRFTNLRFIEFEPQWLLTAAVVGVIGGLMGALYPALRAARQDPVEALNYE